MMRMAVTSQSLLRRMHRWRRFRPYNWFLVPILAPCGYPADVDPNKFTLVTPFEKDQRKWMDSVCINIDDSRGRKRYRFTTSFSQLRMASGRSSRLSKRSSMTIFVIRNRKAWLPTGNHAGPRQSDSYRGRTSLEESTVESARRSTGAGKRAMTWTQSDSGPSNTRQYALKPVMRLRYQAEL